MLVGHVRQGEYGYKVKVLYWEQLWATGCMISSNAKDSFELSRDRGITALAPRNSKGHNTFHILGICRSLQSSSFSFRPRIFSDFVPFFHFTSHLSPDAMADHQYLGSHLGLFSSRGK
jgi:hypothetical protein